MMRAVVALVLVGGALSSRASFGFCGFYVAKADASLYNQASQVVLVRDGDKTALTLSNDFKGEPSEFALVIPVPSVLTREQINVGERTLVERLDAYSAPRLVEYFDEDPCHPILYRPMAKGMLRMKAAPSAGAAAARAKALGVSIEARYTVGEYDILILGAKESQGLETWLTENGYKLPKGASKALAPYIKQDMKFFVAKVNLKEHAKTGFTYLRPIQFAFESPKFMLPIRLGMLNADGPQDLIVYAITRKGRVETSNYRTVKLPTGMDVPLFVKSKFKDFYRALFDVADEKEDRKVVFLEYAWNMNGCDPCAADPLTRAELHQLGVFWLDEPSAAFPSGPNSRSRRMVRGTFAPFGGGLEAFVTRLHVRYDAKHFPEDLVFQETGNQETFQGRYVLRHPWTKEADCPMAKTYRDSLRDRWAKEAETLASLTAWKIGDIRKQMVESNEADSSEAPPKKKWYQNIFK